MYIYYKRNSKFLSPLFCIASKILLMSNKDFNNIAVTFMKYWNVVWDNVRKDFNLVFGNAGGSRRMGLILEQRYTNQKELFNIFCIAQGLI